MLSNNEMLIEIEKLKKEKDAVILAHNYEIPEIQDIADYVGDSLGLSQIAGKTEAGMIVFCGVHFMAETASIISPGKKVIIPDLEAGCSLASSITGDQLRNWKDENPGAVVVSYVNTTADVKAETDYCCTSSNAVKVVNAIPNDKQILFLPDKFLGQYVKAVTGRSNIKIWDGACHVHEKIGDISFDKAKAEHPNADYLIHPECGCSSSCMLKSTMYDECKNIHIFSTEGMINHVNSSPANEFVIATETGILHRMKKEAPTKEFYPANEDSICEYMKMNTVEKLYRSLKEEIFEVKVPKHLADKARLPIERMLSIV
ncbi:MAG: quinolinate synthase NadA [Melioribacteraceae bacterium]|nr:quinolinate synthase NadA [Melioribacteraceae bacterium]MCF8356467.1 quinolinate synthase NadA [Melioribacteraceae bacterium]MCF8395855.1 quinolinate synthase NadA [Melioribacteraceae bacterium]MCF8420939.1 quinolinate synthase NadA [Melioribacteraceae bacterium]